MIFIEVFARLFFDLNASSNPAGWRSIALAPAIAAIGPIAGKCYYGSIPEMRFENDPGSLPFNCGSCARQENRKRKGTSDRIGGCSFN